MRLVRDLIIGIVGIPVILAGCGSDSGSEQAGEEKQLVGKTSLLLSNEGDRPDCTPNNRGQLVYLLSTEEFQACSEAGSWEVINIKGRDGIDGEDGANGVDGEDGKDGEDGGANRIWSDPVSGRKFIFTGIDISGLNANTRCPSGWRLPIQDEMLNAMYAGIYADLIGTLTNDQSVVAFTIAYGDSTMTDYREIQLWQAAVTDPNPDMSKVYRVFCTTYQ